MSEQHSEHHDAPEPVRPSARPSVRPRAIWLLAGASLLPGGVAAVAPEFFHGLPHAFRVTVYVLAGLMIAAVVVLILTQKKESA